MKTEKAEETTAADNTMERLKNLEDCRDWLLEYLQLDKLTGKSEAYKNCEE